MPNLTQILYGVPPANSPPVTVIAEPGSAYLYSGGGYEIAEALMVDTMQTPFPELMDELVLKPAGMARSTFAQALPADLDGGRPCAAIRPTARNCPAATTSSPSMPRPGLWSTPTDLANLLLLIGRAWRGESQLFLQPETARADADAAKWRPLRARRRHRRGGRRRSSS